MLTCEDIQMQLGPLAMGLLDAREAEPLERHIQGCTACTAAFIAEEDIDAQLRSLLRVTAPTDLARDIKAALPMARGRRGRWALAAVAAAAALSLSFSLGRRTDSPLAPETAWLVRGGERLSLTSPMRAGDRLVAPSVAQVTLDGVRLTLSEAEAVVLRAERGDGPELSLLSGRLDAQLPAGAPFEINTPAAQLISRGGRFSLALGPEQKAQAQMRGKIALVVLTAAVTALTVRAFDGDVQVKNAHGTARVPAGRSVGVVQGAPPARLDDDARARRRLEEARTQLADLKRDNARLKDQVERLKEGQGDVAEPREMGEVLFDLKALVKEHGMNLYGTLDKSHPLFKELQAMGPEGIKMLSSLLKSGNDTERFVAAALMEKLLDPAAIPALADALHGENKGNLLVQRMSSHALAIIGGEAAIEPLERAMNDGPEWGVQGNAAYGLAQMGRRSGIDWMLDTYTNTDDPMIRATALPAMAAIGDPSYLPVMHKLLQEETEYSKQTMALQGIAKAGQPESLPILEALIDDPAADKMLLVAAKKAFNEI
ncbi:MAG: hypothetical protein ACI9U2_005071, partial [Bradymonadia bacterium]